MSIIFVVTFRLTMCWSRSSEGVLEKAKIVFGGSTLPLKG
jgi:hypothetical protein